ncbi:MAG: hypothetical protein MR542_00290 [Bacteroidales bacterium]|nr:hypothetical protein [Bacteroidales bacterium]
MKYHVPAGFGFSPKASGFYPFGDATALAGEGCVRGVVWLIQASASNHKPKGRFFWYAFGIYKPKEPSLWFVVYVVCLKSDIPQHKRQVRSTGIAKRLFFMFLFQFPSIYPLNLCFNRNRQIFNILRQKPQEDAL